MVCAHRSSVHVSECDPCVQIVRQFSTSRDLCAQIICTGYTFSNRDLSAAGHPHHGLCPITNKLVLPHVVFASEWVNTETGTAPRMIFSCSTGASFCPPCVSRGASREIRTAMLQRCLRNMTPVTARDAIYERLTNEIFQLYPLSTPKNNPRLQLDRVHSPARQFLPMKPCQNIPTSVCDHLKRYHILNENGICAVSGAQRESVQKNLGAKVSPKRLRSIPKGCDMVIPPVGHLQVELEQPVLHKLPPCLVDPQWGEEIPL